MNGLIASRTILNAFDDASVVFWMLVSRPTTRTLTLHCNIMHIYFLIFL